MHVEGYVNSLISKFFASAAMANPRIPNTNLDGRQALIKLFTLRPLVDEQKKMEEESIFDKNGALKNFRFTISKLVEQDADIAMLNNPIGGPGGGEPGEMRGGGI